MSALNRQVDGNHYLQFNREPIFLCEKVARAFSFSAGCIFKHLARYPFKGEAVTDLEKVKHYFELHETVGGYFNGEFATPIGELELFIAENRSVDYHQAYIMRAAMNALISMANAKRNKVAIDHFFSLLDTTIAQWAEKQESKQ